MGALTAKPFAFQARSWELEPKFVKNYFDPFFYSLKAEYRKGFFFRLLPIPGSANFRWLDDWTRFNLPYVVNQMSKFSFFCVRLFSELYTIFHSWTNLKLQFAIDFFKYRFRIGPDSDRSKYNNFIEINTHIRSPYSTFITDCLVEKKLKFISFYNFNLRAYSPIIVSDLRANSVYNYFFFGTFYDLNFRLVANNVFTFSDSEFERFYLTRVTRFSNLSSIFNTFIFGYTKLPINFIRIIGAKQFVDFFPCSIGVTKKASNKRKFFFDKLSRTGFRAFAFNVLATTFPVSLVFQRNAFDFTFYSPSFNIYFSSTATHSDVISSISGRLENEDFIDFFMDSQEENVTSKLKAVFLTTPYTKLSEFQTKKIINSYNSLKCGNFCLFNLQKFR